MRSRACWSGSTRAGSAARSSWSERRSPRPPSCARTSSLAASWDAALAGLPPDWSDLYAELTLTSTAFVAPASMLCTPINLRLEGDGAVLRFRSAQTFGYGASPGMVRRCFERCDDGGDHRLRRACSACSPTRARSGRRVPSGSSTARPSRVRGRARTRRGGARAARSRPSSSSSARCARSSVPTAS